ATGPGASACALPCGARAGTSSTPRPACICGPPGPARTPGEPLRNWPNAASSLPLGTSTARRAPTACVWPSPPPTSASRPRSRAWPPSRTGECPGEGPGSAQEQAVAVVFPLRPGLGPLEPGGGGPDLVLVGHGGQPVLIGVGDGPHGHGPAQVPGLRPPVQGQVLRPDPEDTLQLRPGAFRVGL